jgi:DNA repair photolyase
LKNVSIEFYRIAGRKVGFEFSYNSTLKHQMYLLPIFNIVFDDKDFLKRNWCLKMILSASRRTDIPAFYNDWFFKRLKEGFVYVRNPMNFHTISAIKLSKDVVDCIVFWTKDPSKIISKLGQLDAYGYRYYFQITINGYSKEIEKNVPDLESAIDSFIELSDKIGKERVTWRYDPIILSDNTNIDYHIDKFNQIAQRLNGHTGRCVISFLDIYSRTKKNLSHINYKDISDEDMEEIGGKISGSIKKYNYDFEVFSCSEKINLKNYGIKNGKCIDDKLISEIFNIETSVKKDNTQREECGCVKSIDIGSYNTCDNGCLYCYANFNDGLRKKNRALHNPDSPLIFGDIDKGKDKIHNRDKKEIRSFIVEKGMF